MQYEITQKGPLLDRNGLLIERGFSRKMLRAYNRDCVAASKMRIKEWDYYLIQTDHYALALTVADNGYMGMDSVSLIDFETNTETTVSKIVPFSLGRRNLPSTSETGDIRIDRKGVRMHFLNNGNRRLLQGYIDGFKDGETLHYDILLDHIPTESMVIATPFSENPKAFYYNQKINCMRAEGRCVLGGREYLFAPAASFAVLDWGRGVWTYRNTWYWGSASGCVGQDDFGFNIGYGFGDTSAASENVLFLNGQVSKLDKVTFHIPQKDGKDDYLSPWTFTSSDGRFEMDFVPRLDRNANMDFKLLCSVQHQVFGLFTGRAVTDNGKVIEIKDFPGFAEKVFNKW